MIHAVAGATGCQAGSSSGQAEGRVPPDPSPKTTGPVRTVVPGRHTPSPWDEGKGKHDKTTRRPVCHVSRSTLRAEARLSCRGRTLVASRAPRP